MKAYRVLVDLVLYWILTGELQDVTGCGGNYTGIPWSFTSPNFPLRYGGRLHCTYIVDAGSTLITLVFEEFNTQNFYDQVQVYDSDGNILAGIDGNRRGYIVQSAIYYRVVFRTNNRGTRKGFKAVWSLTTTEHARYGGYATLSWTLTQPGIREFTVWNSRSGEYILHITNYNNVSAARENMTSRLQFIGHITPSGTGLLRFVIHDVIWEDAGQYECYRGSMSSRGARIPDCGQELAVLGCGGHYNTVSGSLSSRNYLDNTEMYFSCIYTIDAGSTYVTMVFEDLSTIDYVEVVDASDEVLAVLDGNLTGYVMQSANYYRISYNEDYPTKGFRATWSVTTTEHARYGGYATLAWTLPQPGLREFTVWNNDMRKCILHVTNYNTVSIASEELTSKVKFTGNITSSGTGLMRFIITDVRWEDKGRYVCYRGSKAVRGSRISNCGQDLDLLDCGGYYNTVSGSLTSPNYPGNFTLTYDQRCVYTIDAGATLVTLVFQDLITPHQLNNVKVYDISNNLLVQLYSNREGYILQSSTYYRVVFRGDDTQMGFKATWTVTTTEHARYGGYATLSWTLPQPGIREFTVWNSRSGEYILHITNYNNVSAAREKMTSRIQFTGSITPSGTGLLRFVIHDVTAADAGQYECYRGSMSSRGARIPDCGQEGVVLGCGGHFNTPSGTITSPNYPGRYGNYLTCVYVIDAGSTLVTLVFEDFLTYNDEDYVTVHDGYSNRLAHLTGNRTGYIIQSASYYRVYFNTIKLSKGDGFKATWSVTTTEHARYGGYATLSWTLTQPGIREFSRSGEYILHITNYNHVSAAREKMTSRIQFTGSITPSGTGLLRFVIHDVTAADAGQYECYRGSMSSRGTRIPDCGQEVVVLGCGRRYNTSSGFFTSPIYPDSFYSRPSCIYTIDAGTTLVTLEFENMNTRDTVSDAIEVYDESNIRLAYLCGNWRRHTLQSATFYRVLISERSRFKATWVVTTTEHARYGGYATLSWPLPAPGIKEFTVCNSGSTACLLHITDFSVVNTTSSTSRVRFVGSLSSSGPGLFRCLLYNTEAPYIVATDRLRAGSISLTCHVILHPTRHCQPEVSVTWRRNGVMLTGEYHVAVETWSWGHNYCSYYSTLNVRWRQGDRYRCHGVVERTLVSVWSEEHVLGTAWLERDTSYTVVREGNNATLTWKMPLLGRQVSIRAPNRDVLLYMELTNVFPPYSSRVKIVGVVSSPAAVVVRLRLYNLTAADAGVYFCRDTRPPWWQHTLFVSRTPTNPIMVYSQFQQMILLTCLSTSRTLPEHRQLKLSYRWRRNSPHLEDHVLGFIGPSVLIRKEDNETTYLCQAEEEGLVSNWTSDRALYELFITDLTVNNTKTVVVEDGGTLRFKCNVTGYPRTSAHIVNHETRGVYALSDRLQDVTLTNMNASHHGQYICSAVNRIGVTHGDDHPVFVKVKSIPVRTDSDNASLTLTYNKYVMTGTFLIRGYPEPKLNKMYFSRDGNTTVDISNRRRPKISVNPVRDNLFKFTFTITEVLKTELGTYRISIDNEMGAIEIYIKLLDGDTEAPERNLYVTMCLAVVVLAALVLSVFLLPCRRRKKLSTSRQAVSYVPHVKGASMDDIGQIVCSPIDLRESEINNDEDDAQQDTVVIHQEPDKDVLTNDVQESDLPDAESSSGHPTVEMN